MKDFIKQQKADWLRSEIAKLERMKMKEVDFSDPFYDTRGQRQNEQMLAQMQTTIRVHNTALTSIITRYKEELLELTQANTFEAEAHYFL